MKFFSFINRYFEISLIKVIFFIIFLLIVCLGYFVATFGSRLHKYFHVGEFNLKIETTNQTNHLVSVDVIERGLKTALLSCQLDPKHWAVSDVDVYGSGLTNWNDWNDIVQVTNNARVYLRLTNTVPKGSSPASVDNKKNVLHCNIILLEEDHALNYHLDWSK